MGMFDYIDYECLCPTCGSETRGFQSKDGKCDFSTLTPRYVDYFYTTCRVCNSWIEFRRKKESGSFVRKTRGPSIVRTGAGFKHLRTIGPKEIAIGTVNAIMRPRT